LKKNAEDNSAEERDEDLSKPPMISSLKHLNHHHSTLRQEAQILLNRTALTQMALKMVHPKKKLTKLRLY